MSVIVQAPLRQSSPPLLGMITMSLAMLLLPAGDAITKSLTSTLPPSQIAALRALVQAGFLAGAFMLMRHRLSGRPFSIWSFLSGQCVSVISLSLIAAFKTMPIATAIAIFFIEPLLLTLLAGFLLGEKPGPHRYAAIGIGMLGVLLILRPNFATFGLTVFLPVAAAVAYALNMIITRRATRTASALTFQLGSAAYACITLVLLMLMTSDLHKMLSRLNPQIALSLAGAGVLAATTFLLIAYAFSRAEASVLAPFQYLEILGATFIGLFAFGDVPDEVTVFGTLVILGSGMYVFHRERQANLPVRRSHTRAISKAAGHQPL
ncbi:DMT family transporter [Paracoccus albus]|uniref:DMT family transporter n=1 Tax=Paracoccus albus TaxID=3017784 RepID=UPI0022EFF818|nr:DMT family transporter [Paracoccus albus]WBU59644.1 DMT family transporter [Paracoccus albus]